MTTDTEALVRRAYHFAPCAGFWYVRDGRIKEFNCYVSPDFRRS